MAKVPKKGLVVKLLAAIAIAALVVGGLYFVAEEEVIGGPEFQKGMGYVTWSQHGYDSEQSDESLARVAEMGTNWVSILVTWYQTDAWSSDPHRGPNTPTDQSLRRVIRKARELGMKVMLKPHLDIADKTGGVWRGEIGGISDEEWWEWLEEYGKFIEHYIDIANEEDVEMFCIGTELSSSATIKGYKWMDLIEDVRSKYDGKLTYAAHWKAFEDINFWDQLDYVGINVYFPLTQKMDPTYEDLLEGWKRWLPRLEEFYERVNVPIIFPEIGCSSADGAAIQPWEHHPRTEVNLDLQKRYYEALLEMFWDKEWFYGLYWWYWSTNLHQGGEYNRGFVPQNKPAEDVIDRWYDKPPPR